MKANAIPTDAERLAALAAWFGHAAQWFEREVTDSRANLPADPDDDADPEHRVEVVTFLSGELDTMVGGFRRAADMLAVLASPLPSTIMSAPMSSASPVRSRSHLRVVK